MKLEELSTERLREEKRRIEAEHLRRKIEMSEFKLRNVVILDDIREYLKRWHIADDKFAQKIANQIIKKYESQIVKEESHD